MSRDIIEYKGIKYSLRPHGLRSRLMIALSFFVVAFGGALLLASPAQAAAPIFVTVCGDSATWYVAGDEGGSDPKQGDRRPLATSDGLVFAPADLIHHQTDFTVTSALVAGTFVASPAPDQPSFFSIEVKNDDGSGYATLRRDTKDHVWSVTVSGETFTGSDPAALLVAHSKSTHARSFGVGYTNSPPGTVTLLVSSINFRGTSYKLACPIAPSPSPVASPVSSPSPVAVAGPTKIVTVIKTETETVTVPVAVGSTPSPTKKAASSPSPSPFSSATLAPTSSETPLPVVQAADTDDSSALRAWGLGAAGVVGAGLLAAGAVGLSRRRKSKQDDQPEYQGAHYREDEASEGEIAMPSGEYDDYSPDLGNYGPDLGGYPGESYQGHQETTEFPSVRDAAPGNDDTGYLPSVQ